jgi:hypothetical protein
LNSWRAITTRWIWLVPSWIGVIGQHRPDTAGLSKALASDRLLIHDRGRVMAGPGLCDR